MGNVESLHGTTPAEIFTSGIENVDRIEAVALSVLWADGTVSSGWSNADAAQLALLVLLLDEKMRRDAASQML
ncbi:MAG: hypothetical protein COW30_13835 [Rhodospirillales bacterium CG15_BIG_FIL_POST_REV_8_21_14_020_66_15]|nr:MAG: hypothetical protein COW30_13835 [Rhodospirillales bacterium CG15_BIG_FIL_POST_REV_8_21_14_020_66_15]